MAKVTITQIAEQLDLSVATVSRAINPQTQHLVSPETRKRVIELVKRVHFFPNVAAKRLVTGKSRNIVIFFRPQVASLFFDDYYSKMIAGAMTAVDKTAYNLSFSVMKEEDGGFDIENAIKAMDVAGAIVCSILGLFEVRIEHALELNIPVIMINQYRRDDNPACFLVDNVKSMYDSTAYLLSLGHRRIGFVRGSRKIKDAQDRYMGYRKALADHGIRHETALDFQSNFIEESGRKAVRYYFGRNKTPPSAILFSSDSVAMTAISELRRMGISCPDEVSVVGFDGIDAGRYTDPALTTSLQPIYEMMHEAVLRIIRNIEDGDRYMGSRYFTAKIIERGSVAPYRNKMKGGRHVYG